MPKRITDSGSLAFGRRLVALLEGSQQPRRGAGAYLARRYRVATVTANAWLNGEYKPNTTTAKRIAEDHGTTFESLYFGDKAPAIPKPKIVDTGTAALFDDIATVQGLMARALARSIPDAGRALFDMLNGLPEPQRSRPHLQAVRAVMKTSLPRPVDRAPTRQPQESTGRRHP